MRVIYEEEDTCVSCMRRRIHACTNSQKNALCRDTTLGVGSSKVHLLLLMFESSCRRFTLPAVARPLTRRTEKKAQKINKSQY
jgi:hypothetical protein